MASDPYRYFRTEAREILDQFGQGILALEKGHAPELIQKLLRLAHTLKGAARVVKQREIAEAAHTIEDVLTPYRESPSPVSKQRVDALLGHVDAIEQAVSALVPPQERQGRETSPTSGDEFQRTAQADVADIEALLRGLAEVHTQVASLRGSVDTTRRARRLAALLVSATGESRTSRPATGNGQQVQRRALPLGEELETALGSLERALVTRIDRIDGELRQVRETAEQLKLVPVRSMLTALERAMRDTAQALGKGVVFDGRGGEVRLDAHLLATVRGALLQAVGNAVAHGIEPGAERTAVGKPPEGRVVVEVVRRGRRVIFTCQDDGRGVDTEAIRRVAQRRGLPDATARELGAEALLRFALQSGVSTADAVTHMAGRGIGLDIIREAARRLGGEVGIRTQPGQGTTVELALPLSLASIEGLLVEADGVAATIPLSAVRRAVRVAANEVVRSPEGETVVYEGMSLPFLPLARAVAAREQRIGPPQACSAVIVESAGRFAAVGVDRLCGTATVVVRALPELAPATAVVAGASQNAEGTPELVLDPEGLIAAAQQIAAPTSAPDSRRPPILVIDDSLTTRMLEQSILESAGYDVELATSGEEALEKARARQYLLFLVDVEMPGMDGFTFIEQTRADPALRDVPAILVTSRTSPEDRRRGEEVGAQAYVVKSEFEQQDLLERIRSLAG